MVAEPSKISNKKFRSISPPPVRLIAELLPQLNRQPQAVIVNVSSALAFVPLAVDALMEQLPNVVGI